MIKPGNRVQFKCGKRTLTGGVIGVKVHYWINKSGKQSKTVTYIIKTGGQTLTVKRKDIVTVNFARQKEVENKTKLHIEREMFGYVEED